LDNLRRSEISSDYSIHLWTPPIPFDTLRSIPPFPYSVGDSHLPTLQPSSDSCYTKLRHFRYFVWVSRLSTISDLLALAASAHAAGLQYFSGAIVHFLFFIKFKSTIYYAVLDRSPRQTIQMEYCLWVYKCKIVRDTAALMLPFRVVMSPACASRGQENNKENWALRHLPKPALAPNTDHPQHAQPTPKDVPSRSRTHMYLAT
jgi:hypothetical protein